MIDTYSLKARTYPIVILFFPIVVLGVFYSFELENYIHFFTSIGVFGALTYLFSHIGRDAGKRKEAKLWESWGGVPSVQVLRLRNTHFDIHTKQRYHQKLYSLCPVDYVPTSETENNNPISVDEIYMAWTKFVISKTRDTKEFSLLFKENISYGFRRNLWGLKIYGILISVGLIIGNYIYVSLVNQNWNPIDLPKSFQYSSFSLIIILLFWIFKVTKSWVKTASFSYAERLFESVEKI